MSEISENILRIGRFTSSNNYRLVGTPAVAKTYIEEKCIERKLGRSIDVDFYSIETSWGIFLEPRVDLLLGIGYSLCSNETSVHKHLDYLAGTKDFIINSGSDKIGIAELKCYQPKNFAKYTDALMTKDVEVIKKGFPKEYWQAVSNAIIENVQIVELISYCPYKSELQEIRDMAIDYKEADSWKYDFIYKKSDSWLAWIPDGGYYKNLNKFRFEVPEADKILLIDKIKEAGKLLIPIK